MNNLNLNKSIEPFKGEVLLIYLINTHEAFSAGIAIREPKIEEIHGNIFLAGIVPQNYDWAGGSKIFIRFDQIAHFLEFETEEVYFKKLPQNIGGPEIRETSVNKENG